ncbi:hypothetical protein HanXRQr2_Chr08g0361131 [Helianthus annuus]|uniref:Uncharacterized protein n=1 Tax=Helianthus annuus TaxID=4232 RepID=A0A251U9I3_HELAN|nr:uncharacterized protein LOC110873901 [Helianthus annuus]XP_021978620.1 uncharacterized protein LOC110873901 [Helianthus annuus]XP_021978621.1 uncharacterized protein LOC110873901 [Helianthus annuus]KAF5797225.1 hypothetical protein HanXRQr2_Chr08g0361131 [Helianthus annuus]KAJ0548966.1 hypothetical protein HanIR_Chr08g0389791 [Helianthus annuus]KAJ0555180.1 hypothetical protein HanHA89_Chr08g0316711 [Helianthus annuus]KAJ0903381.1 hypothetical protein HanPSC8_Chr08g0348411 [Helianthus annu
MASSASASSNHRRKHVASESMEMEEIVKHMSNLPSYLERGKPIQDRALNFGVLDWGRLEQWQYHHHHHHHKQGVVGTNKHSASSSVLSSGSSLLSHLNMSHEEISTKDAPVNHSSEKKTTNQSRTKTTESRSSVDMGTFQTASSSSSSSLSFFSKGKMKIQDELENEIGNLQDSSYGHNTVLLNAEKSEEIYSDSNESSSKRNARKHRFRMIFKSEAAKHPISQNLTEDSKNKEKVKTGLGNCKEVRVDNSCGNEMNLSSSRKQALFQVAVKNGRPLFTFAVDDTNNDIVAATVRNLSGKDDTNSWIYTFFTVHEVKKKKSGWLYHGSKDKDHGYLPNVTAQMKVSNPTDCTTREFVLSSVDSGQPDHQILDVQLENELAAIVVRFPREEDDEEDHDCFSMTVILPGGHHSIPRKGDPSPLIQRWRSGGRCDCDGWDVGCRLRILTNKVQSHRRSNPPESFDLFLQEDVTNERPFFSLSPVKEGIFSVDYSSSLPLLHAFSICISVIECRKSSRYTELKTYVAKQVDDDVAPISYASLPLVSPVGRIQLDI